MVLYIRSAQYIQFISCSAEQCTGKIALIYSNEPSVCKRGKIGGGHDLEASYCCYLTDSVVLPPENKTSMSK